MNSEDTVPTVVKTTLDNMNLTERFLFDETAEDQEVYNAMVEIIMGEEITLVNSPETEKELRVSPALRQIRLDVIGTDRCVITGSRN